MSIRFERRSGKERRRCTLPAVMALGCERRWHNEQRRKDVVGDESYDLDDEFSDPRQLDCEDPRLSDRGDE